MSTCIHHWHIDDNEGNSHCLKCNGKSVQPSPRNFRQFLNRTNAVERLHEAQKVHHEYCMIPLLNKKTLYW